MQELPDLLALGPGIECLQDEQILHGFEQILQKLGGLRLRRLGRGHHARSRFFDRSSFTMLLISPMPPPTIFRIWSWPTPASPSCTIVSVLSSSAVRSAGSIWPRLFIAAYSS